MEHSDLERRLRELQWPATGEDLRTRILAASRVNPPRVTWSDRVWFSHAWRLAAASAFAVVIAAQFLTFEPAPAASMPTSQAAAEAQVIEQTSREVGVPPEIAATLARRAALETGSAAGDDQGRLGLQTFNIEGDRR